MPIKPIVLQRQMRELGRIRIGNQVGSGRGTRPNRLETFRLTSETRELIEAAATVYGGTAVPWQNPAGSAEWEVITTAAALNIVVPPGEVVSQWMELWSGGGCLRRCDGETNFVDRSECGSKPTVVPGDHSKLIPPCPRETEARIAAASEGLACRATTRLKVILAELPDLGVWRLESHGYYAAVELAGAAEILAMASSAGHVIPARLRLDQRTKKVPGKPTRHYPVPVIEFVETRFADLGIAALGEGDQLPQLGPGGVPVGPGGRPLIPSTTLPPTSDFRPRDVTPPAAATEATRAPTPPAAPRHQPLSYGALVEAIQAAGIDMDVAIARSYQLFPRDQGAQLTDEQRGALFADLIVAPATTPL